MKRILLLILTLVLSLALSSCYDPKDVYNYYEEGDFVFAYKDFGNGVERLYLYGLSKEGKQKKCVTLPEEYKGKKINGFGVELATFYGGIYYRNDFESSILERVYVNFELVDVYDHNFSTGEVSNQYSFAFWYDFSTSTMRNFSSLQKDCVYGNNLLENEEIRNKLVSEFYWERVTYIGNVSYQYNYEEAPNGGYYWVDNYDNALIEYIPPEPTRDGYIFDGWYKEKECINQWYFNNDNTSASYTYYEAPNEDSTEEYKNFYNEYISTHTYVETKLYAKWVKN